MPYIFVFMPQFSIWQLQGRLCHPKIVREEFFGAQLIIGQLPYLLHGKALNIWSTSINRNNCHFTHCIVLRRISLHFNDHLSHVNLGEPVSFKLRMVEVVAITGAMRRALQSSNQIITTNKPTFYRPDALNVTQPTMSEHWKIVCWK